jgi:hypothetical protein
MKSTFFKKRIASIVSIKIMKYKAFGNDEFKEDNIFGLYHI